MLPCRQAASASRASKGAPGWSKAGESATLGGSELAHPTAVPGHPVVGTLLTENAESPRAVRRAPRRRRAGAELEHCQDGRVACWRAAERESVGQLDGRSVADRVVAQPKLALRTQRMEMVRGVEV